MSLILEALSRSSAERQADSSNPGLDTPAYVDDLEEGRGWLAWLPWAVVLLALLAIGLLLVDKYKGEQTPSSVPVVPVQKHSSNAVQAEAGSAKILSPAKTQSIEQKPGAVNSAKPTPAEPVLSDPAVEALYADQTLTVSELLPGKPRQGQKQVAIEGVKETPTSRSESAIDIEAVLKKTEEALKTSRLQEHSAPFINDVSQQFKNDIPTIMYRHHDYSSTPGESSVILGGMTVRAGGKLPSGVKVEEILPDSIVLNFRGKQFRLRALNSWVNF